MSAGAAKDTSGAEFPVPGSPPGYTPRTGFPEPYGVVDRQCPRRCPSPRSAIREPDEPGFPADGTIAPGSFAPDVSRWHHSGLEAPVGKQIREQEEKLES
ncbi:MAG: hypothetical protein AVDCRST_MAG93-6133 [uncultured Chloroflexia bacterium]|uniref:Uncharacterized protein n=1 Tax=uncultured Chloroflexia bacterium TaxID=1672391 RepID=A0A6J4LCB2_9CHLR|nr:MAG: hypothetical protein AVDCRST_MAG93-6133 [uncultured Chloroflexia bacterium]